MMSRCFSIRVDKNPRPRPAVDRADPPLPRPTTPRPEDVGLSERIDPYPAEPPAVTGLRAREIAIGRELRPRIAAIIGAVETLEEPVGLNNDDVETLRIRRGQADADAADGGRRRGKPIR